MKKLRVFVVLLVLLGAGLAIFAQSQPSQKPKEQSAPPMMMCPIISNNQGQPNDGKHEGNDAGNAKAHGEHVFSLA